MPCFVWVWRMMSLVMQDLWQLLESGSWWSCRGGFSITFLQVVVMKDRLHYIFFTSLCCPSWLRRHDMVALCCNPSLTEIVLMPSQSPPPWGRQHLHADLPFIIHITSTSDVFSFGSHLQAKEITLLCLEVWLYKFASYIKRGAMVDVWEVYPFFSSRLSHRVSSVLCVLPSYIHHRSLFQPGAVRFSFFVSY